MSKENSILGVHIFRHGESEYKQGIVPIEFAYDLTSNGIAVTKENSSLLAACIKENGVDCTTVISSPLGRALHTAKVVLDVFEKEGIPVRKKKGSSLQGIVIFPQLTDQNNFSMECIKFLVDGGRCEFEGEAFWIDNKDTNPQRLPYREYITDFITQIPLPIKNQFPSLFTKRVEAIESTRSVQQRMLRVLKTVFRHFTDGSNELVLVTHDALTNFLVTRFSLGEKEYLEPGEFMSLTRKGNELHVKIGDIEGIYNYTVDLDSFFTTQS